MTTLIILVLIAALFYITWKKDQQIKQAYNQGYSQSMVDSLTKEHKA